MDEEEPSESSTSFNYEGFIERCAKWRNGEPCCKLRKCNRSIPTSSIEKQGRVLDVLYSSGTRYLQRQMLRLHMVHLYYLLFGSTKKQAHIFQLSTYHWPICRDAWLFLHDVSARTFRRWVENTARFDPAPAIHHLNGRVGEDSNKFDAHSTACIRTFLTKIADSEGHPLPIRARNHSGHDVFGIDGSSDVSIYLPPRFTKRGLHRMFLRRHPGLVPSWSHFLKVIDSVSHIHVSKRERGLCDVCYISRERLRTIQDQGKLEELAKQWNHHIDCAEDMRLQYKDCISNAEEQWKRPSPDHVMISFDYARQLDVPCFVDETTEGFWAGKKAYDIPLFGIVNEGARAETHRHLYLLPEGVKNGSDTVCSMLYHWIQSQDFRGARNMKMWSDSCTGQNKNNIVLAFVMMMFHNGLFDEVEWRFLEVGHTKFNVDLAFGMCRTKLHHSTCTTPSELKNTLDSIQGVSSILFDPIRIRDWHGALKSFRKLPNIKKTFYYRIVVRKEGCGNVYVYTCDKTTGELKRHNLLESNVQVPTMNDMTAIKPIDIPKLSPARLADLHSSVYLYLDKTNRLTSEARSFWNNLLGNDIIESVARKGQGKRLEPTDTTPSFRRGDGVSDSLQLAMKKQRK